MLSLIKSHKKSSKEGGNSGLNSGGSSTKNNKLIGSIVGPSKTSNKLLTSSTTVSTTSANLRKDNTNNISSGINNGSGNPTKSDTTTAKLINFNLKSTSGGKSEGSDSGRKPTSVTLINNSVNVGEGPSPERPLSRTQLERPPSRNRQPRLGISSTTTNSNNSVGVISNNVVGIHQHSINHPQYLFEEDPGTMSEVDSSKYRSISSSNPLINRDGKRMVLPRTSPNQPPRGYGPPGTTIVGNAQKLNQPTHRRPKDALPPPPVSSGLFEDDPGIMSEAETASTTRSKRNTRHKIMSLSLGRRNNGNHQKHHLSSTLFEEDSGIMSEAETSSTSSKMRRNQKYSLPVVRTPSKTLERPLGMVFLINRGETKRAILPNEITSIITVKALFVRSFNKTLTLDYLESPRVKIYIYESSKDTFNELVNLNEIKDRTILKVFEMDSSGRGPEGLGASGLPPITNSDEVPGVPAIASVEPEYVDSRFVKANKMMKKAQQQQQQPSENYTRPASVASGNLATSSTLPRNAFSTLDSHISSDRVARPMSASRNKTLGPNLARGNNKLINSLTQNSRVAESGYISSPDGNYEFDSNSRRIMSRFSSSTMGSTSRLYPGPANTEEAKARMMHMEAQLNQLTGMVEKALKNKKLGKKQVSFDKSVTFSDDQPPSILTNSKRHQQQQQQKQEIQNQRTLLVAAQNSEFNGQLKRLQRSAKELKQEVRVLKRLTQLQSMAMKDLVQDTYLKLREACVSYSSHNGLLNAGDDLEQWRVAQDEEVFSRELMSTLQNISELEAKVEDVRSGVINKKSKILLQDVESMAQTLSLCSKTVTQLRQAFPTMEANLKSKENLTTTTSDFLKVSSEKVDNAWRRCKKLTGTLVTLRRLASVQEQRFHPSGGTGSSNNIELSLSPTPSDMSRVSSSSNSKSKDNSLDDLLDALQTYSTSSSSSNTTTTTTTNTTTTNPKSKSSQPEDTTDQSLKSPQIMTKANNNTNKNRLIEKEHSPERTDLKNPIGNGVVKPPPPCPPPRTTPSLTNQQQPKAAPPPPPPRTSSTTKTGLPETCGVNVIQRALSIDAQTSNSTTSNSLKVSGENNPLSLRKSNSISNGNPPVVAPKPSVNQINKALKEEALETRHQELLTRQKQLQEQYQRLQEMQKKSTTQPKVGNNNSNGSVINKSENNESQLDPDKMCETDIV